VTRQPRPEWLVALALASTPRPRLPSTGVPAHSLPRELRCTLTHDCSDCPPAVNRFHFTTPKYTGVLEHARARRAPTVVATPEQFAQPFMGYRDRRILNANSAHDGLAVTSNGEPGCFGHPVRDGVVAFRGRGGGAFASTPRARSRRPLRRAERLGPARARWPDRRRTRPRAPRGRRGAGAHRSTPSRERWRRASPRPLRRSRRCARRVALRPLRRAALPGCTAARDAGSATLDVCTRCGGIAVALRAHRRLLTPLRGRLAEALAYPLRRGNRAAYVGIAALLGAVTASQNWLVTWLVLPPQWPSSSPPSWSSSAPPRMAATRSRS
jgi:hypothetical protein